MKQYIDLVKGQLVYADLLHITDTFSPYVTHSKTNNGIGVVRWGAKQLVNTQMKKPGCDDGCLTTPFVRKYDFSCTGNAPQTAEEVALLKKELAQFFADLNVLIDSNIINGVKPSLSLEFPAVP